MLESPDSNAFTVSKLDWNDVGLSTVVVLFPADTGYNRKRVKKKKRIINFLFILSPADGVGLV